MRHLIDHRKLGRTRSHRQAMLKNMACSLILHGRIQTTLPKAKELKRLADRLITYAKKGSIQARRRARQIVSNRIALTKLFKELAPIFASRHGGYTRLLKLNFRRGDQAPLALLEYLDSFKPHKKSSTKVAKKS